MVPTYFRRELLDRVLQRRPRLRTVFFWQCVLIELRPRQTGSVMPRLDRGVQYAEASTFEHWRLWNTGSPAFAGDDGGARLRLRSKRACPTPKPNSAPKPSRRATP